MNHHWSIPISRDNKVLSWVALSSWWSKPRELLHSLREYFCYCWYFYLFRRGYWNLNGKGSPYNNQTSWIEPWISDLHMLPKNVTHSIRLKLGRLAVSTEQLLKLQCSITISSTLESFVFLVFYLRSKDEPFISLMYDIRGFLSPKGLKNDYLCQIYTPQIVVCQVRLIKSELI